MSRPLAHLYDLALRTLDDQQRRADALRGRLAPVLAAAALGVTLLSGPLLGGARPSGAAGALAIAVALAGLALTIAGAFRVVQTDRLVASELDVRRLAATMVRQGLSHDAEAFYTTMIARLGERAARNARLVDRLAAAFTDTLWGIHVMLCGLALAALVG